MHVCLCACVPTFACIVRILMRVRVRCFAHMGMHMRANVHSACNHDLRLSVCRWQYLLPFAINQCGSLVYYITLGGADISMAVPIANSMTFMWTAVTEVLMGEEGASCVMSVTCKTTLRFITTPP